MVQTNFPLIQTTNMPPGQFLLHLLHDIHLYD